MFDSISVFITVRFGNRILTFDNVIIVGSILFSTRLVHIKKMLRPDRLQYGSTFKRQQQQQSQYGRYSKRSQHEVTVFPHPVGQGNQTR